jgi:hypothetical protein
MASKVSYYNHCGERKYEACEKENKWTRLAQRGLQLLDGYRDNKIRINYLRNYDPFKEMEVEKKNAMVIGISDIIAEQLVESGIPLVDPWHEVEDGELWADVKIKVKQGMINILKQEVENAMEKISDDKWRSSFLTLADNDVQCKVGMTKAGVFAGTENPFTIQVWTAGQYAKYTPNPGEKDHDPFTKSATTCTPKTALPKGIDKKEHPGCYYYKAEEQNKCWLCGQAWYSTASNDHPFYKNCEHVLPFTEGSLMLGLAEPGETGRDTKLTAYAAKIRDRAATTSNLSAAKKRIEDELKSLLVEIPLLTGERAAVVVEIEGLESGPARDTKEAERVALNAKIEQLEVQEESANNRLVEAKDKLDNHNNKALTATLEEYDDKRLKLYNMEYKWSHAICNFLKSQASFMKLNIKSEEAAGDNDNHIKYEKDDKQIEGFLKSLFGKPGLFSQCEFPLAYKNCWNLMNDRVNPSTTAAPVAPPGEWNQANMMDVARTSIDETMEKVVNELNNGKERKFMVKDQILNFKRGNYTIHKGFDKYLESVIMTYILSSIRWDKKDGGAGDGTATLIDLGTFHEQDGKIIWIEKEFNMAEFKSAWEKPANPKKSAAAQAKEQEERQQQVKEDEGKKKLSFIIPDILKYAVNDSSEFGRKNYKNVRQKNSIPKMSVEKLRTKLKTIEIPITQDIQGRRQYIPRKELERRALIFTELQIKAKNLGIKLTYNSQTGHKYKSYKRLLNEVNKINSKVNKNSFGMLARLPTGWVEKSTLGGRAWWYHVANPDASKTFTRPTSEWSGQRRPGGPAFSQWLDAARPRQRSTEEITALKTAFLPGVDVAIPLSSLISVIKVLIDSIKNNSSNDYVRKALSIADMPLLDKSELAEVFYILLTEVQLDKSLFNEKEEVLKHLTYLELGDEIVYDNMLKNLIAYSLSEHLWSRPSKPRDGRLGRFANFLRGNTGEVGTGYKEFLNSYIEKTALKNYNSLKELGFINYTKTYPNEYYKKTPRLYWHERSSTYQNYPEESAWDLAKRTMGAEGRERATSWYYLPPEDNLPSPFAGSTAERDEPLQWSSVGASAAAMAAAARAAEEAAGGAAAVEMTRERESRAAFAHRTALIEANAAAEAKEEIEAAAAAAATKKAAQEYQQAIQRRQDAAGQAAAMARQVENVAKANLERSVAERAARATARQKAMAQRKSEILNAQRVADQAARVADQAAEAKRVADQAARTSFLPTASPAWQRIDSSTTRGLRAERPKLRESVGQPWQQPFKPYPTQRGWMVNVSPGPGQQPVPHYLIERTKYRSRPPPGTAEVMFSHAPGQEPVPTLLIGSDIVAFDERQAAATAAAMAADDALATNLSMEAAARATAAGLQVAAPMAAALADWSARRNEAGDIFYVNESTGASTWEHPDVASQRATAEMARAAAARGEAHRELRIAMAGNDIDNIDAALSKLNKATQGQGDDLAMMSAANKRRQELVDEGLDDGVVPIDPRFGSRFNKATDSVLNKKLEDVGINTTVLTKTGERVPLTREELEEKAMIFTKLQIKAKKLGIKLMYNSQTGPKYKSYKTLLTEVNKK